MRDGEEILAGMRDHMMRNAIDPIKAMVRSGGMPPDVALAMVLDATDQYSEDGHRPEFKRFKENMGKIFENEVFFKSNFNISPAHEGTYREPSYTDPHFFFKLYEHFGSKEYNSPEELREIVEGILKEKKILEIGCGPGFGLHVFKDLGAEPTGVELDERYKGEIPEVDIRYGNATNIGELCKDEKFDIIYSKDFFCTAVIDPKDSVKVANEMFKVTANEGLGFHIINYLKFNYAVREFGPWIDAFKRGENMDYWERWFEDIPDEEKANWCNKSSLDPQYLIRAGFNIEQYKFDNDDLVMITSKRLE
jgi:SAM-dependent methyltransferase